MADWLLNLPLPGMALVVFLAIYLFAGGLFLLVNRLAATEWAKAFKGLSAGLLSPLGILFALLVGFIAVEVWSNFDKAKSAVAAESGGLRALALLSGTLPDDQKSRLHGLINRHIETAVNEEWPAMARQEATLAPMPAALVEALDVILAMKTTDDRTRAAQPEMLRALHTALEARRQRIVVSEAAVGSVKWMGILLQGFITLFAIAVVHSDNRRACAIALTLFATGIALSVLLIAAYSRPFTGANSVGPQLLTQVSTR